MQKLLEDQKDAEEKNWIMHGDYKMALTEEQILKLKIARTVVPASFEP